MELCDLHCHSVFSDGTCTPEELVDLALSAGLKALALTDHNTTDGLPRFVRAAEGRVGYLCGCELTTDLCGRELHLLALYRDEAGLDSIRRSLAEQTARKDRSTRDTIDRLAAAGYDVSYAEFRAMVGEGYKNRVHIGRYFIEKGIVPDLNTAFASFLSPDGPYYTEPERLRFFDMLPIIRESGGVSVWAHPLLNASRAEAEDIARSAAERGLTGMEVYYSEFSDEDTSFLRGVCARCGLTESGGSDFHGENKSATRLGSGHGGLRVPLSCFRSLLARMPERG